MCLIVSGLGLGRGWSLVLQRSMEGAQWLGVEGDLGASRIRPGSGDVLL